MATLSLTADHLVQVGGGAPQEVTVLSGATVYYSTDRTRDAYRTIQVGETATIDQSAWMWSPTLSDVQVVEARQPSVMEVMDALEALEETHARDLAPAPEPPKRTWSWQRVSAAVVLGAGWLAGVLGAVGVLH